MGVRNKRVELYRSLDEISVYRFDKAINGDLRYLAKVDYVGQVSIDEAYKEAWSEIYNEYIEKTKGTNIIQAYLLKGEILYLRTRLEIVPALIKTVLSTNDNNVYKYSLREIKLWGFPIDDQNELSFELEMVRKAVRNSINKLKRKQEELKRVWGDRKVPTIQEQKVRLHTILGVDLNLKTTNMLEWIAYWEEAYAKQKRRINGEQVRHNKKHQQ